MNNNREIPPKENSSNHETNSSYSQTDEIIYLDFPQKYKRRIFDSFDKRFVIIWLITFVVHIITIIYLVNNLPQKRYDSTEIEKIQKKYADLILKKQPVEREEEEREASLKYEERAPEDLQKEEDALQESATSYAGSEATERAKDTPIRQREAEKTRTTGERAESRRSGIIRSGDNVQSKGLLGLLTGSAETSQKEGVEDILSGTSGGSEKLKNVLNNVKSIEGAEGTGGSGTSTEAERRRQVKGTRSSSDEEISDLITERTKAESKEVGRQESLEKENISTIKRDKKVLAGNRDPDEISLVVHRHNKAIESCYQRELKRNPALRGKIVVRFTIAPDGRVKNVELVSSTINNPRVERCVVSRIRRWDDFGKIDESLGDTTFRQVYTFGY